MRNKNGKPADEGDDLLGEVDRDVGQRGLQGADIVHEPRHQLTGPPPGKEAQRKGLEVAEEMRAEIRHDVLARRGGQIAVPHGEDALAENSASEFGDRGVQSGRVPLNKNRVHQSADHPKHGEVDPRHAHHKQGRCRHPAVVWPEKGKESTERGQTGHQRG